MNIDPQLISLHGHWLVADAVRQFVAVKVNVSENVIKDLETTQASQLFSMFKRLQVWYALLYVVIEGYQELKLQDENLDILLKQKENVELLKRFRHATFHYQKSPLSNKFTAFLYQKDTETWINKVNKAFQLFFEKNPIINDYISALKK